MPDAVNTKQTLTCDAFLTIVILRTAGPWLQGHSRRNRLSQIGYAAGNGRQEKGNQTLSAVYTTNFKPCRLPSSDNSWQPYPELVRGHKPHEWNAASKSPQFHNEPGKKTEYHVNLTTCTKTLVPGKWNRSCTFSAFAVGSLLGCCWFQPVRKKHALQPETKHVTGNERDSSRLHHF